MGIPIYQVDAFTEQAFKGNPAAVCLLHENKDDAWMQDVAREMNLSETAFLIARGDGFNLRWFTPTTEVDLCGHATLAGAHVLWESGTLKTDQEARFETSSGHLSAKKNDALIELDFPAEPGEQVCMQPDFEALGIKPLSICKTRTNYLMELANEEMVRTLKPDMAMIRKLPVQGVIVTSRADTAGFDFVSRYFAPQVGIDEDPVTGSAHCTLGPYWRAKLGKDEFRAYQASQRGGVLNVRVAGDRVIIGGKAVTVFRAELLV
ncbi:MAG: PhzF family phenazine biosynthesis protein [Syntrophaceae bacterium]